MIIDDSVSSLEAGACEADLILLAVPVNETVKILAQLTDMDLKSDVLISDAGSTKDTVVKAAKPLIDKGVAFIGGTLWLVPIRAALRQPNYIYSNMHFICLLRGFHQTRKG